MELSELKQKNEPQERIFKYGRGGFSQFDKTKLFLFFTATSGHFFLYQQANKNLQCVPKSEECMIFYQPNKTAYICILNHRFHMYIYKPNYAFSSGVSISIRGVYISFWSANNNNSLGNSVLRDFLGYIKLAMSILEFWSTFIYNHIAYAHIINKNTVSISSKIQLKYQSFQLVQGSVNDCFYF